MPYDATNPEHFALFGLNYAQLRRRGLSDTEIADLRQAQRDAPPASSAADVAAAAQESAPTSTTRRTQRTPPPEAPPEPAA